MESFVQALGRVELNSGIFLHLENFLQKFLGCWSRECRDIGLNVATLKYIPLCSVTTLDSKIATLKIYLSATSRRWIPMSGHWIPTSRR